MRIEFEGRSALVTGGANGIGLATARLLRDYGATVWLADLPETAPLEIAARERVIGVELDVTSAASVESAFERAGAPELVVANAGIGRDAPLLETTPELWQRTLDVNLTGVLLTVQAAARRMKPLRRGSIVLTASTNSFDGERWLAAYNSSKAALLGLLHTAANELGPWGLRVNAVCPGYIRTRLTAEGFADPAFMKDYTRHLPMGRGGEPEEVARAIAFLLSDSASFITGAHLFVDGGQMAAKLGIWDEKLAVFRQDHWELK